MTCVPSARATTIPSHGWQTLSGSPEVNGGPEANGSPEATGSPEENTGWERNGGPEGNCERGRIEAGLQFGRASIFWIDGFFFSL